MACGTPGTGSDMVSRGEKFAPATDVFTYEIP